MKQFYILLCIVIIMTACGSAVETPQHSTATPTLEHTPITKSILFKDDFNGSLAPEWEWKNEDPNRWNLTEDGWLQITAFHPGFPAKESGKSEMVNVLVQPAPEGSFTLTTRMVANPAENFQQAGIIMIHDDSTYVSVISAMCSFCLPDTGGYAFFIEAGMKGEYISEGMIAERDPEAVETFLRLVYSADANSVTGFVSSEPDNWRELGVIEDFPVIQEFGLGAANAPGPDGIKQDLMAYYSYIEVSTYGTVVDKSDPLPKLTESRPEPTLTAAPSPTPEPTDIPEPTAMPEPTPLPEGVLLRDDFEDNLQPGWEWINENPDKWSILEFAGSKWLQIYGDKPGSFTEQRNTLMRALPEGDFILTTLVLANPRQNHQQANIFIFENQNNYIRLNFGFCDHCGLPEGGYGYFMETVIDNNPFGDLIAVPRGENETDVYLKLEHINGSITGYYATEYGEWQRIGAFGNYFDFVSVGLGATNSVPEDWEVEDIEALFEYFEISLP